MSRSTLSDDEGRFVSSLLPLGTYLVAVVKDGYSQAPSTVQIPVTETSRLSIRMKIAGLTQSIQVHANASQVHGDELFPGAPNVFWEVAARTIAGQKVWPGVAGVADADDVGGHN